jgi:Uma2 family endonuclease
MAIEKKLYTVDEYEAFISRPENRERRFELIDGDIVEMTPTQEHGLVTGNIYGFIWTHNRVHKLGYVMVEARYRLPGDQHNAYIPDVSFIVGTEEPIIKQGAIPRMPDIAIEVKPPDDSTIELREKAAYYLSNDSKMVLLVYPSKRIVEVYRKGADVEILLESDTIDGGDLLPGFTLLVRDIFPTE